MNALPFKKDPQANSNLRACFDQSKQSKPTSSGPKLFALVEDCKVCGRRV